ncbi:N-carbamyl-L-amino acid amidohydrolase [Coccomyxa subellipsoidea C-169]|uniref:N-carbamyl-L-amino acid amidohydrolase n=1 Tax=Coccomyxa subellipsoidea (strain C-169) TaxID=574566 RepID=I0YKB9_COCSC|nr:N-carbamyl-L-amino acid amidohydrolase [Coccomyxa subellipsoidea C-169]EIE18838.1 N-carbamyl-L-amino acid amidohydrolase [Coccomyxa subellipsoidea C-169]|eukprot:XP_005643382.1 N-carbamyl-L-amino acid amidohydrolase [Coccomyxa subellipsoidea C-169]
MKGGSGLPVLLGVLLIATRTVKSINLDVSGEEIASQLLHLATFTDDPNPAVTRIVFTENDLLARGYVKELMTAAGLTIREDPMGNIFGRWEGSDPDAGAVMSGSHADAIPLAGAYDGTLGVIGPIAAVAALRKAGFQPRAPIDVLMFTSEEPTRFGLGCIGSRGMAGELTAALLDEKLDVNGTSFLEASTAAGYGGSTHQILDGTLVKEGAVKAFVELHIEQGPLLEAEGTQLGIVTAIAAPAALRVFFSGDGGHAGALLMPYRNDAGLAAAEVALAVEASVLETGAIDAVGTTGLFEIGPNTVNSVPREAKLEIDIRDIDAARRDAIVASVLKTVEEVAARRKVRHRVEMINQDAPATCSDQVISAAAEAAEELGVSHKRMVSRAYHDSLFMARFAPTGMIFIPCRNGWSHRPDEFATPGDIERGIKALALTLAKLAGSANAVHSEL